MAWFWMLIRPLSYLLIRHPRKGRYDFWLPLGFAVASGAGYMLLPERPPLTGGNGVFLQIQELVKILAGFFIAALAAIATFQKDGLDAVMLGQPPVLDEFDPAQGRDIPVPLTRRRFLCFLFGYLSFLGIGLYILVVIATMVKSTLLKAIGIDTVGFQILVGSCAFIFFFLFWHMFSITLLGLYYLTDRLHRP